MVAVDITTAPTFRVGQPKELFKGTSADFNFMSPLRGYDVASDGQKFLMARTSRGPHDLVTQLNVVFNWFEELKRAVPPN